MKFGVNSYIWGATFGSRDFAILPRIRDAGFDGIEVPIFDAATFEAEAIGREVQRLGLECAAVAMVPPGLSLASPFASIRQQARTHLAACISAARDAGARLISGPMYTPVGHLTGSRRTMDEWHHVVDGWQALSPVVLNAGLEVALEPLNRFETYFLNTTEDAVRLCDEIDCPAIGILFDTFHANIEEKAVPHALLQTRRHLKHVHACENDRGIPGTGHVPWVAVFDALAELQYDRWLTIESFSFSQGPLAAAAAIWRDLAPVPEAIAFEGLSFLRSHVGALREA